ncbi:MAG: Lrp/AsnC family transcriptional regulator [Thermoplasmata archaeon]
MKLDEEDKKLISVLQEEIPLERRPFEELGKRVGLNEEEVVERVKRMTESGILKRIAPLLYHRKAGFEVNGMVVWKVPRESEDDAGLILSEFDEVSHCYLRETTPEWKYNLYSMVHAESEEELKERVEKMAEEIEAEDHDVLRSTEELKKTSLKYFDSVISR